MLTDKQKEKKIQVNKKQKELLEDSIIIYRVQRAPERRVFYVDVGNMPPNKAMGFVERVKNEIHQKRIPNKTGGGTTIMDAGEVFANVEVMHVQVSIDQFRAEPQPNLHALAGENAALGP